MASNPQHGSITLQDKPFKPKHGTPDLYTCTCMCHRRQTTVPGIAHSVKKSSCFKPKASIVHIYSKMTCTCRYVQEVADDHLMVQLASTIKARLSIFDSAEEPQELSQFPQGFREGQPLKCRISQVSPQHWVCFYRQWAPINCPATG